MTKGRIGHKNSCRRRLDNTLSRGTYTPQSSLALARLVGDALDAFQSLHKCPHLDSAGLSTDGIGDLLRRDNPQSWSSDEVGTLILLLALRFESQHFCNTDAYVQAFYLLVQQSDRRTFCEVCFEIVQVLVGDTVCNGSCVYTRLTEAHRELKRWIAKDPCNRTNSDLDIVYASVRYARMNFLAAHLQRDNDGCKSRKAICMHEEKLQSTFRRLCKPRACQRERVQADQ